MENKETIKRKPGRPFTEKGATKKFFCEFCCRSYKCNGPNDSHVRQHHETDKCRFNRQKYYEKSSGSQTIGLVWPNNHQNYLYENSKKEQFISIQECS